MTVRLAVACLVILAFVAGCANRRTVAVFLSAKNGEGNYHLIAPGRLAIDRKGNFIVAGWDFGSREDFGVANLDFTGYGNSVFVAKYGHSDHLEWIRQSPGESFSSMAVDTLGSIYIAGFFRGSARFGDTEMQSCYFGNYFLSKYDTEGKLLWTRQGSGTAHDLAIDGTGNVVVAGMFGDSSPAGRGSCGPVGYYGDLTLTNAGFDDAFIAKYDTNGRVLWVRQIGGPNDDRGYGIAVDQVENIYVTGIIGGNPNVFSTNLAAHAVSFGTIALTNDGVADGFLSKYDSHGQLLWARTTGIKAAVPTIMGDRSSFGVACDDKGNAFITGTSRNSPRPTASSTNETGNIFIEKFSPKGSLLWNHEVYGQSQGASWHIATDHHGNAFLAGLKSTSRIVGTNYPPFNGISQFGPRVMTTNNFSVYIKEFDGGGRVNWSYEQESSPTARCSDILVAKNRIFLTGNITQLSLPLRAADTFSNLCLIQF